MILLKNSENKRILAIFKIVKSRFFRLFFSVTTQNNFFSTFYKFHESKIFVLKTTLSEIVTCKTTQNDYLILGLLDVEMTARRARSFGEVWRRFWVLSEELRAKH